MQSQLFNVKTFATILLASLASFTQATAVDFGGSVRLRAESKQTFNLEESSQTYWLSQIRVHANTTITDDNALFVEFQDARVHAEDPNGIPGINEDARNQPFSDQLDIHQLHWMYVNNKVDVKVGRQKFNLGDKRLVASLEWVNTARVHDGARFTYKTPNRHYDVFASTLVSIKPDEFNDQSNANNRYFDSDFHGAFISDKTVVTGQNVEYWWFYRDNNTGLFNDSIHTLGARLDGSKAHWSWDIQFAWQTGDFYDPGSAKTLNHNAAMLHASTEYTWSGSIVGIGYSWASGDEDPSDDEHGTFDNLYPLNHAYYGYMDLFSLQNIHNLELTYVRPQLLGSNAKLRIAWHQFWLDNTNDAWYNAGLAGNGARRTNAIALGANNHVGNELDTTLAMPVAGVHVVAGFSYFFAGDYASDTGSGSDAHFLFLQLRKAF